MLMYEQQNTHSEHQNTLQICFSFKSQKNP